jgi:hypothetical protein
MILVVFCLGCLINFYETQNQQNTITTNKNEAQIRLLTAGEIILGSKNFNCDINGIFLTHTIDKNKILSLPNLKEIIGLRDYNVQLSFSSQLGTTVILNDVLTGNDMYGMDLNFMLCEKSSKLNTSILKDCFDGNCYSKYFSREIITIKVAR